MFLNLIRLVFISFSFLLSLSSVAQTIDNNAVFSAKVIKENSSVFLKSKFKNYDVLSISSSDIARHLQKVGSKSELVLSLTSGLSFELNLEPAKVKAEHYRLEIETPDGKKEIPSSNNFLYTGKIKGDSQSDVRLAIKDNFIYGSIKGNGQEYFIEPLSRFEPTAKADEFILYEMGDIITTAPLSCGFNEVQQYVEQTARVNNLDSTARGQNGACKKVKFVLVADYSMYKKFENDYQATETALLAILNVAQGAFNTLNFGTDPDIDLGSDLLQFEVVQTNISTCGACDQVDSSISLAIVGPRFKKWISSNTQPEGFQINLFWTTRQIQFAGVNLGGQADFMPGPCSKLGIAYLRYSSDDIPSLRLVSAHEIGHVLGCRHDDEISATIKPQNYIMYSRASSTNTTFSTLASFNPVHYSSLLAIRDSVAGLGNCLGDCSAPSCEAITNIGYRFSTDGKNIIVNWGNTGNFRIQYKKQSDSIYNPSNVQLVSGQQATITNLDPCFVYIVQVQKVCGVNQYGPAATVNLGSSQIFVNVAPVNGRDSVYDLQLQLNCLNCNTNDYRITIDHIVYPMTGNGLLSNILLQNLFADGARHRLDIYKVAGRTPCTYTGYYRAPYGRKNAKLLALTDFKDCQMSPGWQQEVIRTLFPATDNQGLIVAEKSPVSSRSVDGNLDSTCMIYYNNSLPNPYAAVALVSPKMDVVAYNNLYVSFDYHYLGYLNTLNIDPSFRVDVFDGNNWIMLMQSKNTEAFKSVYFDRRIWDSIPRRAFIALDGYRNKNFQVRIVVDDGSLIDNNGILRKVAFFAAFDNIRIDAYEAASSFLDFVAYPNPSSNEINVRFNQATGEQYQYKMLNVLGQVVGSGKLINDKISIKALNSGIYFLQVFEKNGNRVGVKRILKG